MSKPSGMSKFLNAHENLGKGSSTIKLPDGVENFEIKKGRQSFDIIPFEVKNDNHPYVKKGEQWFEKTFGIHASIGPENKWFICPKITSGKRCYICEEHLKMKQDPNADQELTDSLKPKFRQLFNVRDRKNKAAGIQVLDMSFWNFGAKLEDEIREAEDGEYDGFFLLDKKSGKTLKIRWTEKKLGSNSFLEAGRIDFVDRVKSIPSSILEDVVDLDSVLNELSYEEMKNEFTSMMSMDEDADEDDLPYDDEEEEDEEEVADESDEDEEEEDDSDDDEDDESDEDDEDDEEEEDEDDEADEDDDDEEEEEEAPKRKRRPKKKSRK